MYPRGYNDPEDEPLLLKGLFWGFILQLVLGLILWGLFSISWGEEWTFYDPGPDTIRYERVSGEATLQLQLGWSRSGHYPLILDGLTAERPVLERVIEPGMDERWPVLLQFLSPSLRHVKLYRPAYALWREARAFRVRQVNGEGEVRVTYNGRPVPVPVDSLLVPAPYQIKRLP